MPAYSVEEHLNYIEIELAQIKKQMEADKKKPEINLLAKGFRSVREQQGI